MDISVGEDFPEYYKDTSETHCPICEGQMTRGMEECVGICDKCYVDFQDAVEKCK